MAQLASKVAKMGPPGATFAHFAGIFGHLGRSFVHFYQVFVNTCVFLMKIHGKTTKIQRVAVKIMNVAQKRRKGA